MSQNHTFSRPATAFGLGFTQLIAFGTTLYLLGVLAVPIHLDTGWPLPAIAAGLSLAVAVSALLAPHAGKQVRAGHGGRLLMASTVLFAIGLLAIAAAHDLWTWFAGWAIVGCGMATGLYDTVFGTLGTRHDQDARPMISMVALVGGFASTAAWAASGAVLSRLDWRLCVDLFAAAHLLVNLPIYALIFGRRGDTAPTRTTQAIPVIDRRVFLLVAAIFMIESCITTCVAVHLITLFREMGRPLGLAIAFGAIVGPCQVAGRLAEMTLGRKLHPIVTVIAAAGTVTLSLLVLATVPMAVAPALALYGAAIGVLSIARGLLPLKLFGGDAYAVVMGRLARPISLAQAMAPAATAVLVDAVPGPVVVACIASASGLAVLAAITLWRIAAPRP